MDNQYKALFVLLGFIVFVIIMAVAIPSLYNSNVDHVTTHSDYCDTFNKMIQLDKRNGVSPTVIIQEVSDYSRNCSN